MTHGIRSGSVLLGPLEFNILNPREAGLDLRKVADLFRHSGQFSLRSQKGDDSLMSGMLLQHRNGKTIVPGHDGKKLPALGAFPDLDRFRCTARLEINRCTFEGNPVGMDWLLQHLLFAGKQQGELVVNPFQVWLLRTQRKKTTQPRTRESRGPRQSQQALDQRTPLHTMASLINMSWGRSFKQKRKQPPSYGYKSEIEFALELQPARVELLRRLTKGRIRQVGVQPV